MPNRQLDQMSDVSQQQQIPDSYFSQQNREYIINTQKPNVQHLIESHQKKEPIYYINDCGMFPSASYRSKVCNAINEWSTQISDDILNELDGELAKLTKDKSKYTNPEILKQWLEKLGLQVDDEHLANHVDQEIVFVCTLPAGGQSIQFIAKFAPYDDIMKELLATLFPEVCSSTFFALAKFSTARLSGVVFTEYMGESVWKRIDEIIGWPESRQDRAQFTKTLDFKKLEQAQKLVDLIDKMFVVLCQFYLNGAQRGLCLTYGRPHSINFCFGKTGTEDEDRLFLVDLNSIKVKKCENFFTSIKSEIYDFVDHIDAIFHRKIDTRNPVTPDKWFFRNEKNLSVEELKKILNNMRNAYKERVYKQFLGKAPQPVKLLRVSELSTDSDDTPEQPTDPDDTPERFALFFVAMMI